MDAATAGTTAPGTTATAGTLWARGAVATAVAATVNVVVALVARAALDVDPDVRALQPGPVLSITVVAMLAGTAVYVLLRSRVRRPGRVFAVVAYAVAVVSLLGPLSLLGADPADFPGVGDAAALALIPLHLIPALVLVPALTRRPR